MTGIIFSIFLCLFLCVYSLEDEELAQLHASIEDITHPTLEDYKKIDSYLKQGKRPYLAPLIDPDRLARIKQLQLLGPNEEMPLIEIHSINPKKNSNKRAILLFASSNGMYSDKARKLLTELTRCGYSGDVVLRLGGFPNIEHGGLLLCHVPYAFKVCFLEEARLLGYEQVLWLDTAMHPLSNLMTIFSTIEEKGYFFTTVGPLSFNASTHLLEAAAFLHIGRELYPHIPHLSSSMVGLNMHHPKALQLLEGWLQAAKDVYPFITCWPEELSLSVVAWRENCKPHSWFGNCVCSENELQTSIIYERPLEFYIDSVRDPL